MLQKIKSYFFFSILPDKFRNKETLLKIKDIDFKDAEKLLNDMNGNEKKEEKNLNYSISKDDFKKRLQFFESKK